jgi:hypothetical protein
LNDSVTAGNWPEWFTASVVASVAYFVTAASGTCAPDAART